MQGHDLKKLINKVMKETGQTAREGKLHPLKRQGEGAENYKAQKMEIFFEEKISYAGAGRRA